MYEKSRSKSFIYPIPDGWMESVDQDLNLRNLHGSIIDCYISLSDLRNIEVHPDISPPLTFLNKSCHGDVDGGPTSIIISLSVAKHQWML
jgi:hypothetical protein